MNIQRNICTILRKLRTNQQLTQYEFAKIFNLSQTHYANIENGKRNATLEMVETLIFQFEVSPNDVFQKQEEKMSIEERLKNVEAQLQNLQNSNT